MQPRWLGAWRRTWNGALPPACVDTRDRTQNRGGEDSEGKEPQESTDGRPQPGQVNEVVAERTPGGSKASKWACRPFTGEPSVGGMWTVRATRLRVRRGDRTSDRKERRPGSCVPGLPSGGLERQRAGANGKAAVNLPQALRRRRSESEPTRKQVARESGYGSPGRESSGGALQGRERHERRPRSVGGHGERRGPKGLERAAC